MTEQERKEYELALRIGKKRFGADKFKSIYRPSSKDRPTIRGTTEGILLETGISRSNKAIKINKVWYFWTPQTVCRRMKRIENGERYKIEIFKC